MNKTMKNPRSIEKICVFLGSKYGNNKKFLAATQALGKALAQQKITLIYGGSKVGLMGELADATLAHGGEVIGVTPQCLYEKEVAHEWLTELHVTDSMSSRKTLMKEMADAFIILPGGLGTLDELFEVLTEHQVGLHSKPVGVLNINQFFTSMFNFLGNTTKAKFFNKEQIDKVVKDDSVSVLLERLITGRGASPAKNLTGLLSTLGAMASFAGSLVFPITTGIFELSELVSLL